MLDSRFEGEKNLAKKLEGFDYGDIAGDLPKFDEIHNQSPKKPLLWTFIKTLFVISFLGGLIFYIILPKWDGSPSNEQHSEVVNRTDVKAQDGQVSKTSQQVESTTVNLEKETTSDSKTSQQVESTSLNIEKETASDSKTSQQGVSTSLNTEKEATRVRSKEVEENGSGPNTANTPTETNSFLNNNKGGTIEKRQLNQRSQTLNIQKEEINDDKAFGIKSSNVAPNNKSKKRKKEEEMAGVHLIRTQENCRTLFSSISLLEDEMTLFEGLLVETEPNKVENNTKRGISFGIQYNKGKTHEGAHETPFVASFPTSIKGGESFGYGFFGHVNLDKRNSIRPSFTYMKNSHFQFIEGLSFPSGPTGVNMELYSHELKFGLDYAFNFLPNFKLFDVKAGGGVSYHKVISLESNNYFTMLQDNIKDSNELDLSPFSYKLFIGLEIPVYKGFVFGLEPYVIYQKRRARYTPSTFIADQGDYNLLSGLNLTLRF